MKKCKFVDYKYLAEHHWTPQMIAVAIGRLYDCITKIINLMNSM
jgi:hypothetical protein